MRNCGSVSLLVLVSSLMFFSCSQGKRIERQISYMSKKAILLDTDSLLVCNESDSVVMHSDSICSLKMVVWADSSECSQCYVRQLDLWKGYALLERENPDKIKFYFILETDTEEFEEIATQIHSTQLKHPIYVDTSQYFRRKNPNIPTDVMFHTFLLDSRNNVILVGNPIKNQQVEMLLKNILNKNLGLSVSNDESL